MTELKKRILLVEDEPHLAFNLEFNLQAEGYDVVPATNGVVALEKYEQNGPFDLIILDIMIPEIDGFEVARRIRKIDQKTGILMLTARASEADVISGLETGADDYMTKPFHLKELLLRIKRMAERSSLFPGESGDGKSHIMTVGPITLDTESLKLKGPRGEFDLTVLESNLMKEFLTSPRRVLSRELLLKNVWGVRGSLETRTVDNFVMRLRKYLEEDPSNPEYLESVRGRGYRFVCPDDERS